MKWQRGSHSEVVLKLRCFFQVFSGIFTSPFQSFCYFHPFKTFNPTDISGSGVLLAMALSLFLVLSLRGFGIGQALDVLLEFLYILEDKFLPEKFPYFTNPVVSN